MQRFTGVSASLLILGSFSVFICRGQVNAASEAAVLGSARLDLAQGRAADAEKFLRDYLGSHPSAAESHYQLAYVFFKEDKPADSLKEYTEAAKYRRPTAEELRTVSLDYVLLKDYNDAQHWIHYSLSMDANNAEAWYDLGRIEYTRNKFQASVDAFQQSLKLDPASVKAENNLGLAYEGLNQIDKARTAYRKALAMQASSAHPSEQPLLNLGILLINENQLDEALNLLQRALAISSKDWKILAQLGRLYSEKGDLADARKALEASVALAPNEASLHFQLGHVYRKSGAAEQANAEFAKAKQLLDSASTVSK